MWLFANNHPCFGYIEITTLNNKNTFGAPYGRWKRKNESEGSERSHVGNRSLQVIMGNEQENGPRGHLLRPN